MKRLKFEVFVCVCVSNWNFRECMWFLYLCVSIIGFHVSIAIGGLHGYRASSDDEGDREVHVQQRVLCPDWHIHRLGVCRVSISGAIVTSFWISGRLFHNQWLSFSYLERPHQALRVFPLPCTILVVVLANVQWFRACYRVALISIVLVRNLFILHY